MVFTVFLLSCCTLCCFLCQKVNSLMLCFTPPMPQVNTLTLLSFDTPTVLCWSRQTSAVCFTCATWSLLLSSCKKSCCCMQLVVIKTFCCLPLLVSVFVYQSKLVKTSKSPVIVCSCLFLLSSLVAVFGVYYVYFSFSFGFFCVFSLFSDAQSQGIEKNVTQKWVEFVFLQKTN